MNEVEKSVDDYQFFLRVIGFLEVLHDEPFCQLIANENGEGKINYQFVYLYLFLYLFPYFSLCFFPTNPQYSYWSEYKSPYKTFPKFSSPFFSYVPTYEST